MFQNLIKIFMLFAAINIVSLVYPSISIASGITVYKSGDKYAKIGGRIQFQYHHKNHDTDGSEDSIFFRRLRPYLEGSIHKNWKGKFQWDMGSASDENEMAVKDAYLIYTGFEHANIRIGNFGFPFSREYLTSSKKQQLVERSFVGDHNYGTPDRNAGVHANGGFFDDNKVTYGISAASASIDPDADKIDFDTPVNKHKDFNQGWIAGGRLDFHPFGKLKFAQGDFTSDLKATLSIASFLWNNDGDNNTRFCNGKDRKSCDKADPDYNISSEKPDIDSVVGVEVSGALRFMGFSIDVQYNMFNADTVDSNVTGGIYKSGSTALKNFAVEGGYMIIPDRLELVAAYQTQDADNYTKTWTRTSLGANYFFNKKHDIKMQFTYRIGANLKGKKDIDENELFLQMQYVF